jgi:hypothetical protein
MKFTAIIENGKNGWLVGQIEEVLPLFRKVKPLKI